jgi:acetyl esterase/lipase
MKNFIRLVMFFVLFSSARAQTTNVIKLWPDGAPGALGTADKDIPTLTPFLPEPGKVSGAVMIVCPGGSYEFLANPLEGGTVALWLTNQGITAFVLKYRLGSSGYHHPIELGDAARAMRLVRSHAAEWKLDPKRIGIMGFSAGGHLASTLMTHFDAGKPDDADPIERESCRPDLGVLVYPAITMKDPKAHKLSRDNLLGKNPSPELIDLLSNELHVTKDTPTCFIFHGFNDRTVPVENSLQFATAMRAAGVPVELHLYAKGGHGIGLGATQYQPEKFHPWAKQCELWLKAQGFAK